MWPTCDSSIMTRYINKTAQNGSLDNNPKPDPTPTHMNLVSKKSGGFIFVKMFNHSQSYENIISSEFHTFFLSVSLAHQLIFRAIASFLIFPPLVCRVHCAKIDVAHIDAMYILDYRNTTVIKSPKEQSPNRMKSRSRRFFLRPIMTNLMFYKRMRESIHLHRQ